MKAYWLESGSPISVQELKVHGIDYMRLDINNYQSHVDRIKNNNGYTNQEIKNFDAMPGQFDKEHSHVEDEFCLCLTGRGVFDIRSNDDSWMRVEFSSSDTICIPAQRHHRLLVAGDQPAQCVRLFKDISGLTPMYRSRRETALA